MDCPPLPEASHAKARQVSKGVVDEPPSETSKKEYQIDLKKKITLLFQTSKPDPFLEQIRENPTVSQFEMEEGIVS